MKLLNVLFMWHMHQPAYSIDNEPFMLPWTRLHSTKDYIGMADVAARSSAYRMTFNFTPVLWHQILQYAGGATDRELEICARPASALSLNDRQFLINKLFTGNHAALIDPFPRYAELMDQFSRGGEDAAHRMTERDIRDLIVWRILSWIYPGIRNSDSLMKSLVEKGSGYTEAEKEALIEAARAIIASVPERYKTLNDAGQIEMVTTPFYHPILPVLIDSDVAEESAPGTRLPPRFRYPDDARWHIREAIRTHSGIFGEAPEGMWPAEGSVSRAAAGLFAEAGIRWIASDEAILFKSMGVPLSRDGSGRINRPDLLYRPWICPTDHGDITMFFRDHLLSDLIGFDYHAVPTDEAVTDFIRRLHAIREATGSMDFDPCVCIILDGENAWEHYLHGGFEFLDRLYRAIASEQGLHLETMTTYLNMLTGDPARLPRLHPGSWINGDFSIWIGDQEENAAWNALRDLRDTLGETLAKSEENTDMAMGYLRKAQASDTFWWFGDDHFTTEKAEFDLLFRRVLIRGYEQAGQIPPSALYRPLIMTRGAESEIDPPKNLISPVIDGDLKSYFDWFGAGSIDVKQRFSAMHGSETAPLFIRMKFGFDHDNLFLRLDPVDETARIPIRIDVVFESPDAARDLSIQFQENLEDDSGTGAAVMSFLDGTPVPGAAAFDRVCEIRIPFSACGIVPDDRVQFYLEIWTEESLASRIPDYSDIEFFSPTEDYNSLMWRV
ncbi:MAG TPA: glycoside hydrolase family 57 protein [bacterium]|nr:glycoside hydrolase family 57 protein [bacterium]